MIRPTTAAREDAIWRCHLKLHLGAIPLARLSRSDVQALVAELAETLAPATVVRVIEVLKTLLQAAVHDGILDANPAIGVRLPTVEKTERRFLTAGELARIEAAMDPLWPLIVPFAAATGLRIGEIAALKISNLRLAAGEVVVSSTAVEISGHRSVGSPKSRAGRRVVPTIHQELARRLTEHIHDRGLGPDDLLFANPSGTPMRQSNWRRRVWNPAVEAAGIADPKPTPHALRHTAVAAWISAGVDIFTASRWAGHSSTNITEQIYGHLWKVDHSGTREAIALLLSGSAEIYLLRPTGTGGKSGGPRFS